MRRIICILICLVFFHPLFSFSELLPATIQIENSFLLGSGNDLPHWLTANSWGTTEETDIQNVIDISFAQLFKINDIISFIYGFDVAANVSESSSISIEELYYQFNLYGFSVYAGKKRQTLGDVYEPLSTGSMVVSEHASPIPRISAGFFDYVSVPFTRDILEVKGLISHGWFQGDRYTDDILLHEKALYGKLNLPFGISPYVGLVHEAMWGGSNDIGEDGGITWENFWRIFFADEGGDDAPTNEQLNRLGNHLGIWDFGIYGEIAGLDLHAYYQHFFEDRSGLKFFQNGIDGLWGLSIEHLPFHYVDTFLYEYVQTTDQSGAVHNIGDEILGGFDRYYDNWFYQNGWTHLNSVNGNSFFSTIGSNEDLKIANNRMKIHHVGIHGSIVALLEYTALCSFARYYPAYVLDADNNLVSLYDREEYLIHTYFELERKSLFNYGYLSGRIGLGYDFGSLEDSFGVLISAQWCF